MIMKPREERKISQKKITEVASLSKLYNSYNLVLVSSISGISSVQVQKLRERLRGRAIVRIVKKRVLQRFFNEVGIPVYDSLTKIKDSSAVIFTDEDVFTIVKLFVEGKDKKRAKAGQIAPSDIIIEAGPTFLMAGPAITELSEAGLKTGIEKGKIIIREKFVVNRGNPITQAIVNSLSRLNIFPFESGVIPIVAYQRDNSVLYGDDSLVLDIEGTLRLLRENSIQAYSLTLEIGYFTRENILEILRRNWAEADALVKEAGIITKDSVVDMLVKAHNEAKLLG